MTKNGVAVHKSAIHRVRKAAQTARKAVTKRRVLQPPPSELRMTPDSPALIALRIEAARLAEEIQRQQVLTQDHPTSGNHMADDASEVFEQTKNLALKAHLERTLEQVLLAIHRMEQGTYGICEKCGNPIGEDRLRALPYATTCVKCAKGPAHAPHVHVPV